MLSFFFLLLLAFPSILGEEFTNSSSCLIKEIFDENDDEGTLKDHKLSLAKYNCTEEIEYEFVIKPKKEHWILLILTSISEDHNELLELYYIVEGQEIFVNSIHPNYAEDTFSASEGVGFRINGSANSHFQIDFQRIHKDGNTLIQPCPYPIIKANSSPQTIRAENFPLAGCSFVIKGNRLKPVTMVQNCESNEMWNASISRIGDYYSRFPLEQTTYLEEDIHLLITFDIDVYDNWRDFGCKANYFLSKEDYCNCSQTEFILPLHTKKNLTSPGYPTVYCADLLCKYNFTTNKTDEEMITGWVISAVHMGRAYYDSLALFTTDKETETSYFEIDSHNSSVREDIILIGETLQIHYQAYAKFNGNHGFSLDIEAIHQPIECICPSDTIKRLNHAGRFKLEVPSKCSVMLCKFQIPNDSDYPSHQMLRMKINYLFAQKGEYFEIRSGSNENRLVNYNQNISNPTKQRKIIDWQTDESILFTFRRENLKNSMSNRSTQIDWEWEWMTEKYCACGKGKIWAEEKWLTLYSPRWPENYCDMMNCSYLVVAPDGYHLELNVTSFYTESHSDFVKIFDGSKSPVPIETLSGLIRKPYFFEIGYQSATIKFNSDETETRKGWKIAYRAVKSKEIDARQEGHLGWWISLGTFLILLFICGGVWLIIRKFCMEGRHIQLIQHNFNYGKFVYDEELAVEDDSL